MAVGPQVIFYITNKYYKELIRELITTLQQFNTLTLLPNKVHAQFTNQTF